MKVCYKCLKALESREGPICFLGYHNLDEEVCDCCGETAKHLFELLTEVSNDEV